MTNPIAEVETSLGRFEAEVLLDRVPRAAEFFMRLVREEFYDGLHFHRFVEGFVQVYDLVRTDPTLL